MRIVIAGGHGQIALLTSRILAARGIAVTGLIRHASQSPDLAAVGATPAVLDLESASAAEVADVLHGADAAVFAAGAGPGSGADRKYTVDRDGSVKLAVAAEAAGVAHFVQISTMGAGSPPAPGSDEGWTAYIDAKTQAEEDLRTRSLNWQILRPGRLTDTPGTGLVTLSPPPVAAGAVPRADVASVLATLLTTANLPNLTLELTTGPTPITDALAKLH